MNPDFLIIPYQVYINKNLTAVDGYLYGIIYWLERLKNGKCTASNQTLSEIMNITPGSVQNSLQRLEKEKCIARVFKDKQKKLRTEIICLVTYERVSLNNDTVPLNDDTYVSLNDDHISNNIISNSNKSISFSEFWTIYPKKVDKKKSEAKWNRLTITVQRTILADIPKRKQTSGWKANYIPNPTTYLNGERWNDEIKTEIKEHIPSTYKPVKIEPNRTPEEQSRVNQRLAIMRKTLVKKLSI